MAWGNVPGVTMGWAGGSMGQSELAGVRGVVPSTKLGVPMPGWVAAGTPTAPLQH